MKLYNNQDEQKKDEELLNFTSSEYIWLKEKEIKKIPWINDVALQQDVNVLWGQSWWWWGKMLIFNRSSTAWTWLVSFTWFWFKPKWYRILAARDRITTNGDFCYSDWWYDWTTQTYLQIADNYSRVITWGVLRLLYVNQWWWEVRAAHSSFDNDWITLNFLASSETCTLFITCF